MASVPVVVSACVLDDGLFSFAAARSLSMIMEIRQAVTIPVVVRPRLDD
jgi:hypothetical protein